MKKFAVVKAGYCQEGFFTEIVEADSLLEVLSDFADDCAMGWEEDDGVDTIEKAIEAIRSWNGDGGDTLISVIDLDTKEVVFEW